MNRLPSEDTFPIDRLPEPSNIIFADANLIALKPLFRVAAGYSFSGSFTRRAVCAIVLQQQSSASCCRSSLGPFFIIVILQLFVGICKALEPVTVQAFIEYSNDGVLAGLENSNVTPR